MAETSAQAKLQELIEKQEKKNNQGKASTSTQPAKQQVQKKDYDIDNNRFAQVVLDEDKTPEEKKKAIAELLTVNVDESKEENQARLKEFELFKEYLQSERLHMAQDIINLTDTEAFAEMHDMFTEMNAAILEFDDSMKPLTDVLDAVYKLRQEGAEFTLGVYKEIKEDEVAEAKRKQDLLDQETVLKQMNDQFKTNEERILALGEQKSFFGFGKVKEAARIEIAKLQSEQLTARADIDAKTTAYETLKATPPTQTKYADWLAEKEQLRSLLQIDSDEWRERSKRLVASALGFVDTTSVRGERVLESFGKAGEQIAVLGDANRGLSDIYALVTDASTEAAGKNQAIAAGLAQAPENESQVDRIARENLKRDVDQFIGTTNTTAINTVKVLGELAAQGINIMTMKGANDEQVTKARELVTSGIASVAEGLSTTLTTVSAAATNESSELARNSAQLMRDRTDLTAQTEALRQASGIADQAAILKQGVERLKGFHDTATAVRETAILGMQQVKEAQKGMKELAEATRQSADALNAVPTEMDMQDSAGASDEFNQKAGNDNAATKTPAKKPSEDGLSRLAKVGQGSGKKKPAPGK